MGAGQGWWFRVLISETPDFSVQPKKVSFKQPISIKFSPIQQHLSIKNIEIPNPKYEIPKAPICPPSKATTDAWNKFLGHDLPTSRSLDLSKFNISADSVNTDDLNELLDDFDAETFDLEKAAKEQEEKFLARRVKKEAKCFAKKRFSMDK